MHQASKRCERLLAMLLIPFALTGCQGGSGSESSSGNPITITLVDSAFFTCPQKSFTVSRGDSLSLSLTFATDYVFASCSYSDYTLSGGAFGDVQLVLNDILYPQRVEVQTKKAECAVRYNINGGSFIGSSENTDSYFMEWPSLDFHSRPNAARGTNRIQREGYVLTGWNTAADGTGDHVGLGSRFTLKAGTLQIFYAQWEKAIDDDQLIFAANAFGFSVTGYRGTSERASLVIPEAYQGKPVNKIRANAFKNVTATAVVLPSRMKIVESGAFVGCSFTDIYLPDTIMAIADDAFSSPIRTWHINAASAPRYLGTNDNTEFADDMDRLILFKDRKKMIFYAGCSMSYGLKSEQVAAVYGSKYTILDMGVIGGTTANVQFDMMTPYLTTGDVFLHAPEVGSPYQVLYDVDAEIRVFMLVEGNYDLLARADMTQVNKPFTAFSSYAQSRVLLPEGTYDDHLLTYNAYGDISISRPYTGENKSFSEIKYTYETSFLTDEAISRLADKYDAIRAKGATVLFSFSPVNLAGLDRESAQKHPWQTYSYLIASKLEKRGYPIISTVTDYLYNGTYFYNEDYHLNDFGAEERTYQLLHDLAAVVPIP
jgi:hypothetical protein